MQPAEDPRALNTEGSNRLARGDTAGAAAIFARAAAADPGAPTLWMNLANARRMLGDDDGERAALDRVLAIDATEFAALIRKAQLQQRLGETAQAAITWSGALAVAPAPEMRNAMVAGILRDAESFVAERRRVFADAIDADLAAARAGPQEAELRRFDTSIDAVLGRRRIYESECAGLRFAFLPADEFFPRYHFSWFNVFEAATPIVQAELASLLETGDEGFAPYVGLPPGAPRNKWTELDGSDRWSAYYLWKYGAPIETAIRRCPNTAALLERMPRAQIPGRCPSAFFSVLRPHSRIPPHTGVSNTRAVVHLPLIIPDGCGFRVGGETRQWRVGEAFAFDDTIEHEAWNDSDHPRVVLIIDVWNPHLTVAEQRLVQTFYTAADRSGLNTETLGSGPR